MVSTSSRTKSPTSDVEYPMRPASRLFKLEETTWITASSIDFAASGFPMWRA